MQSDERKFSPGYTRLRTLAMKSIIGFGKYQHITVENLIDLKRYTELLSIYYRLNQVDFNEEIKNALKIRKEWQIPKPGKDYKKADLYIPLCLNELINQDFEKGHNGMLMKNKSSKLKEKKVRSYGKEQLFHSKGYNQNVNRGIQKEKW